MNMPRLTKQQRMAALEMAAQARRERGARGEREPLDEWPDGPPEGDEEATKRWNAATRQWHQKHVGPLED